LAVDVNELDIFERPASTGIQSIENGTPVLRALVQAIIHVDSVPFLIGRSPTTN